MISCRAARASIETRLEGELELERRFRLEHHLADCPACTLHERRARAVQELLEGRGDPPVARLDSRATARAVFARLEHDGESPARPARGRALLYASVAAVLAAVALHPATWKGTAVRAAGASPAPRWTASEVEADVRAALLEEFPTGPFPVAMGDGFRERTRELARSGWPVRRFVEGALDSPDVELARAAAHCLGALAEEASVPALERALVRAELVESALGSLGSIGAAALPALERAFDDPRTARAALLQVCRVGGERASAAVARAARSSAHSLSSESLLDALTTTGPAAVASLLELAAERLRDGDRAASDAILWRLHIVEGAGPALAHVLERESLPGDLAYRALAIVRPSAALPWLEERCGEHRERAAAFETLAAYPGPEPFEVLLRLEANARAPRPALLQLLVTLLERDGPRARVFSEQVIARETSARETSVTSWLDLLTESRHPAAAPALLPVVASAQLPVELRERAVLVMGELGTPEDAELLLAENPAPSTARPTARSMDDLRVAGACAVALHALVGASGVERLLAGFPSSEVERVVAILELGRSSPDVLALRVARALASPRDDRISMVLRGGHAR